MFVVRLKTTPNHAENAKASRSKVTQWTDWISVASVNKIGQNKFKSDYLEDTGPYLRLGWPMPSKMASVAAVVSVSSCLSCHSAR